MALEDALRKLQEQENQMMQLENEKPVIIAEWQTDVAALLAKIREYLARHAAAGLVSFINREIQISEEWLGTYKINAMSICSGPATIMIDPVARFVLAFQGAVDMYRSDRPGDRSRITFLRHQTGLTDPTVRWMTRTTIKPPRSPMPVPRRSPQVVPPQEPAFIPLDQAILEQRLEFLLTG